MTAADALIVIPARGGSKGIPHKNIRPFAGKPLIHHTIAAALEVAPPEHVMVSTDDPEIAECARKAGITVDFLRPAALATDTAGSREVILDAMERADIRGLDYSRVILLQPTSPLRTADDIRAAIRAFDSAAHPDMAVTVTESAANPYYDCFETDSDGFLRISKGSGQLTRRQDAPHAWQYNGAVYVIAPEALREKSFGKMTRKVPVEMPRERSVDLDTPLDWEIAELIYARTHRNDITD